LISEAKAKVPPQSPLARVPHAYREHAPEMIHEGGAVLLVEMRDHLAVSVGLEPMTGPLEIPAELQVVVYLAVEHAPDGAVLVGYGLGALLEVDDAQTPESKPQRPILMEALVVWPPVDHGGRHGTERIHPDGSGRSIVVYTGNTAHVSTLLSGSTFTEPYRPIGGDLGQRRRRASQTAPADKMTLEPL
jgi:hypothetical protein